MCTVSVLTCPVFLPSPLRAVCVSVCRALKLSAMHLSSQVQTLRKRCVHCEVQGMLVNTWALLMPSLPHANMLMSSTLSTISLCPPSPSQNERHYIMQVVCEATQCAEEPRVRRGTWGGGLGGRKLPIVHVCPEFLPAVVLVSRVCVLCCCRSEWRPSRTWSG